MKIRYDREVNAIYIRILEKIEIENSEEVKPGVIYDFSNDGKIVGIEIFLELNPDINKELKLITAA